MIAQKTIFGGDVEIKLPKLKKVVSKEKHVFEYIDKNDYQYWVSFIVATSHAQARYLFAQEHGLDFKEELGEHSIKILRYFDKYIKEGDVFVDPFQDDYWITALYKEGGYLLFPNYWEDGYGESIPQTLEKSIEWKNKFEEECNIKLPTKNHEK